MNKHIVAALANYNFTIDKQNAYGNLDGYEVNVIDNPLNTGPVFVFSTFLPQSKKNDFVLKLNQRKLRLVQAEGFDFGVMVKVSALWSYKEFLTKIPEMLTAVLEILQELEAPKCDICPQSGEPIDPLNCRLTTMPNTKVRVRMSTDAISVVNSTIDKTNEDFEQAPNNYLKGFLGIAIGAIAGIAVAFVAGLLGYITSFAPIVSIFLGVFLYQKFGGKPNHVMIIMSLVTTLVSTVGFTLFLYITIANEAVAEINLALSGMDALKFCLENSADFKSAFVSEVAITALFYLIASGVSIFRLIKMIQRPKNIQ